MFPDPKEFSPFYHNDFDVPDFEEYRVKKDWLVIAFYIWVILGVLSWIGLWWWIHSLIN
jgi:hypothetical protein